MKQILRVPRALYAYTRKKYVSNTCITCIALRIDIITIIIATTIITNHNHHHSSSSSPSQPCHSGIIININIATICISFEKIRNDTKKRERILHPS
jgi:hypothetical protein